MSCKAALPSGIFGFELYWLRNKIRKKIIARNAGPLKIFIAARMVRNYAGCFRNSLNSSPSHRDRFGRCLVASNGVY